MRKPVVYGMSLEPVLLLVPKGYVIVRPTFCTFFANRSPYQKTSFFNYLWEQ